MIKALKETAMKTADEHIKDLEEVILKFEAQIKASKVTKASLDKAQAHLDGVEKANPPTAQSTNPLMLSRMYEFQALIDLAKGNLKRANAFVAEAKKTSPDTLPVSETVKDLAEVGRHQVVQGEIPFFVVSAWRFVVMSILTIGLYSIYWFYKNWKAVEAATGRKQHPVLSGIFCKLVSYNLFLDIKNSAEAKGVTDTGLAPGWRALLFFFVGPLALIGINRPMMAAGGVRHKKFTAGEAVFVVLGLLYWGFVIFGSIYEAVTSDGRHLVSSRSHFVSECKDEATQLSDERAREYCGCLYDNAVGRWGRSGFARRLDEGELTSELREVVDLCNFR
jgi:hypothetical protein